MYYTFDHNLFLWLNFDGGAIMDKFMVAVSTPVVWSWLYVLLIAIIWRRRGWRSALLFVVLVAAAVGLTDLLAGIFKHSGPLKHLWESFPARLRPMHTPELEGLVHVVKSAGRYGTVSAHAGTMSAIALMSVAVHRWMLVPMLFVALLISYSRIYLACHFPMDIALGFTLGLMVGGVLLLLYRHVQRRYLTPKINKTA